MGHRIVYVTAHLTANNYSMDEDSPRIGQAAENAPLIDQAMFQERPSPLLPLDGGNRDRNLGLRVMDKLIM